MYELYNFENRNRKVINIIYPKIRTILQGENHTITIKNKYV